MAGESFLRHILGCVCVCVNYQLSSVSQPGAHPSIICFVMFKLGFSQPHFWLPPGSSSGSARRGCESVAAGPEEEEGTCFFLSASSSHEGHFFAPAAATVPS